MADIFLSYATEDRSRVEPLVRLLHREGYSVWWDRRIGIGSSFDREIERELELARCVVVVWSRHSTESDWVRAEAQEGLDRGILVPVCFDENIKPPLAFRRTQTANLRRLNSEDAATSDLLAAVARKLGSLPQSHPRKVKSTRTLRLSILCGIALVGIALVIWKLDRDFRLPPMVSTWPEAYHLRILPLSQSSGDGAAEGFGRSLQAEFVSNIRKGQVCPGGHCRPLVVAIGEASGMSDAHYAFSMTTFPTADGVGLDAALIRAADHHTVWSKAFSVPLAQMAVQRPLLSGHLANVVSSLLSFDVRYRHRAIDPWFAGANDQAMEDWFDAERHLLLHRLGEGGDLRLFERLMKKSVESDPAFFAGYISLAVAYNGRIQGTLPLEIAIEQNEWAIVNAHASRPEDLESSMHQTAHLHRNLTWDYEQAMQLIEHLIERSPRSPTYFWELADIHDKEGRIHEALDSMRLARAAGWQEDAPVDFLLHHADLFLRAGESARALGVVAEASARIAGGSVKATVYRVEAAALLRQNRVDDATNALESGWMIDGIENAWLYAHLYAEAGEEERARQILARTERRPSVWLAKAYIQLGESSNAIGVIEQAVRDHENYAPIYIRSDALKNHLDDARYLNLIRLLESEEVNTRYYRSPLPPE